MKIVLHDCENIDKISELKDILTIEPNGAFRIPNGIFRDTFIPSKIGLLKSSDDKFHLYAVIGIVDFCHEVLVVRYDHFSYKERLLSKLSNSLPICFTLYFYRCHFEFLIIDIKEP